MLKVQKEYMTIINNPGPLFKSNFKKMTNTCIGSKNIFNDSTVTNKSCAIL